MGRVSPVETPIAAKPHVCSWCGERIDTGQKYRRYRVWNGPDTGTMKLHPECYAAVQEEAIQAGGWLEWPIGSAERPSNA